MYRYKPRTTSLLRRIYRSRRALSTHELKETEKINGYSTDDENQTHPSSPIQSYNPSRMETRSNPARDQYGEGAGNKNCEDYIFQDQHRSNREAAQRAVKLIPGLWISARISPRRDSQPQSATAGTQPRPEAGARNERNDLTLHFLCQRLFLFAPTSLDTSSIHFRSACKDLTLCESCSLF